MQAYRKSTSMAAVVNGFSGYPWRLSKFVLPWLIGLDIADVVAVRDTRYAHGDAAAVGDVHVTKRIVASALVLMYCKLNGRIVYGRPAPIVVRADDDKVERDSLSA